MAIINWEKELSVNITELDEQHKKLIDIINDLHNAMLKGKSRDILDKVLDNLIDYTKNHFRSEEILFEKYNYPDYLKHKKEHDDLVKQVLEIQEKYKSGKIFISIEILDFLKNWVSIHILQSDKHYTSFLNSNGVY